MTTSTVGIRYAKAVLNLASEQSQVERVGRELESLASAWRDNRELQQVFENPVHGAEVRRGIAKELAESAGASDIVRHTVMLLSDRQRLAQLPEVAEAYRTLAERREGLVRAEVITATELPDAYFGELQAALEGVTGKKVSVVRRVDPSIIGGVITRVGDRVYDGSVKHRLEDLKEELLTQT